ncbi:MAG: phosphodiester glycosidase family protein, partial [Bacilli bacterium]|nr:phosphodiester glycosidase family protein [Bacilli bacterium]
KMKKTKKIIISIIIFILFVFLFLLYGPIPTFREYLITSSMSTMKHQYIAHIFYSDNTIKEVLDNNKILETDEVTNPKLINISNNNSKYKLITIKEKTYTAFLVEIYNPSKVKLATTKYLGNKGENILDVSKREKAIISINGGGFYDPNWSSNGEIPHGVVIKNNKVISNYKDASVGGGYIGFNKENKLILGKMSKEKAISIYKDAIEFGPFLIINGKQTKIKGNGGWGIAPRTAIGQRKDGTVLFLVVNGRIPSSIGASMNDISDLMKKYGAYNAANLDGGSSSELVIKNKIINIPVGGDKLGLRNMPTFWIVKK